MTRHLWWAGLVLSLVGCGGAPSALPEGEQALEAGRMKEAEALLMRAQKSYLTDGERARVKVALGKIARHEVSERAGQAGRHPGWKGYEALAETRRWYRLRGGLPDDLGDRDLVARMIRRAERLWPEVAPLRARKHYVPAVQKAVDVLAPLPTDGAKALRELHAQLKREGRAWHKSRLDGAPDGVAALHAGIVRRLGGEAASPLEKLKADAQVAVKVRSVSGRCAEGAAIKKAINLPGKRKASLKLSLKTCTSSSHVSTQKAQYTYVQKVPYQVTKSVRVGSERYLVTRKRCTQKMPGVRRSGGQVIRTETTRSYDCSVYGSRDVYRDRLVTKYRNENRTGVRETRTRNASATLRGTVELSWDGGKARYAVGADAEATDTAITSPTETRSFDGRKSKQALRQQVLRQVIGQLSTTARQRVRAADGARWRGVAQVAADAGKVVQSEDADVRAAIANGISGASAKRLEARYGLSAAEVMASLEAKPLIAATRGWFVSPNQRAKITSAEASYTAGEAVLARGWAWGLVEIGLRTFGASGIPLQPDRSSASLYMRLNYAFLAHAFDDAGWGWALYDSMMLDFWLGGRTSESVDYRGGDDESPLAGGIGVGYQLMVGYRGKRLGLFGGMRTQNTYRAAGDYRTGGATHPLVGRMELRISERHPVFIEAYGLPQYGTGEITGLDVVIATGSGSALVLRAERLKVNALFGGLGPKDNVDLGRHESWTLDINYGMQF